MDGKGLPFFLGRYKRFRMHVLVLGGTGFIGSHIVDALLKSGHRVRVLGRTFKDVNENEYPDLLENIQADFGDSNAISKALNGVDIVIHLVSTTVPSSSNLDPVADIESNLINSVKLFNTMLKLGVKRIIYFSSGGTVYGNPVQTPITEQHPTDPISSYGITKLAIEKHLFMQQKLNGLKPVILRLSNPYGPRQGHFGSQGVIGTFLKQIIDGEAIKIWGDGSVIRDYIFISDAVSACIKSIDLDLIGTYNIGSGRGHSLLDIVNEIEHCTKRKAEIVFEKKRSYDVKEVVLDTTFAQNALNWRPKCSLREGIKLHYEWLTHK